MSKAFTRESDDELELPASGRPASVLPPGTPNYLTADGADRLRSELAHLSNHEHPAAQSSDLAKASGQLRRIEQRIRELGDVLSSATIVPAPERPWDQVGFGAIVAVRRDQEDVTYRIVGVDEVDLDRGWVSWVTPVARALMNARVGDRVPLQLPGGRAELEVLKIQYPSQ